MSRAWIYELSQMLPGSFRSGQSQCIAFFQQFAERLLVDHRGVAHGYKLMGYCVRGIAARSSR